MEKKTTIQGKKKEKKIHRTVTKSQDKLLTWNTYFKNNKKSHPDKFNLKNEYLSGWPEKEKLFILLFSFCARCLKDYGIKIIWSCQKVK